MAKKNTKSSKEDTPPPSKADKKAAKKGGKVEEPPAADKPKPVIARPSSGKTPISLLHEHAQKNKWGRVEYDMIKVKDGMKGIAKLAWIDPKSKENITIRCDHSLKGQETSIEARYDAATVALHRVSFNKNISMVLPREYKDIWAKLEDERKVILKQDKVKHDRIYNNEPFKVYLEEKANKLNNQKQQEIKRQQELKTVKKTPIVLTSLNSKSPSPSPSATPQLKKKNQPPLSNKRGATTDIKPLKTVKFPKKVWDSAPSFRFSTKQHELIQSSIKSHIKWRKFHESDNNTSSSSAKREVNFEVLQNLGFRETHIKEALKYQDPLSFLLFNIPDDDLPAFFMAHEESSASSKDLITIAHKNEHMVKKVMEFGISRNQAILALKLNNGVLKDTIISLTQGLINYRFEEEPELTSEEQWEEELNSLSSIYEDDGTIKLLADDSVVIKFSEMLNVTFFKPLNYPNEVAGVVVSTTDSNFKVPNYVKLKIVEKLAEYIKNNLLGMCYIFSVMDWLQQNCESIIENPGQLVEDQNSSLDDDLDQMNINGSRLNSNSNKRRNHHKVNIDLDSIKSDYESRQNSPALSQMIEQRAQLPAWKEQTTILNLINSNQITLVTGETGSGKSTQLVQFILDKMLYKNGDYTTSILCTQPRRISAIGLAERVADERVTKVGQEVGYVIRGVNKTSSSTKIKFVTNGILVKILQNNAAHVLNDTVLVIDEVHERSMEIDLILIMIKRILQEGKVKGLRVVLMSATVDVKIFQGLFGELQTTHIKGRTFPIQDYYLDDVLQKTQFKIDINGEWIQPKSDSKFFQQGNINYDLIAKLVERINQEDLANDGLKGSILIFLPGVAEISKCVRTIQSSFRSSPSVILPLHSALTSEEQQRVFNSYPGKRKIIVSTNIAETSITINDCVVTIDSGKVKQMTYNNIDNTTKLVEIFESKAEAKQRRGRAGRVSNGISYKLYTEETYGSMISNPVPEIKRINLDSLYLMVKSMGIASVSEFLAIGIDPPSIKSLMKSEEILKCGGLIDEFNHLTQLGTYISMLPTLDPKHGKLLIYSILFNMVDLGVLISSVLSVGTIFLKNNENRDAYKASLNREYGDLISSVLLVREYLDITDNKSQKAFLNKHAISFLKIQEIKTCKVQFLSILKDIGFIPMTYKDKMPTLNDNDGNLTLVKALVAGSFYPQIARVQLPDAKYLNTASGAIEMDQDARFIKYWIRNEEYITKLNEIRNSDDSNKEIVNDSLPATRVFVHPSSILFDTSAKEINPNQLREIAEFEKLKEENMLREDGLLDFSDLVKLKGHIDWTPEVQKSKYSSSFLKNQQFLVYNSSSMTNKLYIRDLTPTSMLSTLLFGGTLNYELNYKNRTSPGIVLDDWLPIKTWSKNAVLIKELRTLLDETVRDKLENGSNRSKNDDILRLVKDLLEAEGRI